jgi:uncharacterized DUF497 family protein
VANRDLLADCVGFDWDEGNIQKNWDLHSVTPEEVFFGTPWIVRSDVQHSRLEKRYYVMGRCAAERQLFVVFAVRRKLIRVISARDMNRRERESYETFEKTHS